MPSSSRLAAVLSPDLVPTQARTTTTVYSYAEKLASELRPRAAAVLLGLRWSFGRPKPLLLERWAEFSLPLHPVPLDEVLAARGGLVLRRHDGDDPHALLDHLSQGRPAIVAIDAFYLPFRPAYRRIHSARSVLVRPGTTPGEVEVEDGWRPPVKGQISLEILAQARFSDAPRVAAREPIFAGSPVGGVWYEVDAVDVDLSDLRGWATARLGELWREMQATTHDERGDYGMEALRATLAQAADGLDDAEDEERQALSLLLRPELSSRLYFCAFLRAASRLLASEALADAEADYRRGLGHWQMTVDLLTKTLRTRKPEYDAYLRQQLRRTIANEERLLERLEACEREALGA